MMMGDCCHLPGSNYEWSGSPAFSKVIEAALVCVVQVTSADGVLSSTIIWTLAWPSNGPFCRTCPEGVDGQRSPSPSGCMGTLGRPCPRAVWRGGFPQPTPATENCATWSAAKKQPWPLVHWLKGPGPGMETLTWHASWSSLPRHAPSRQAGCPCTCAGACARA